MSDTIVYGVIQDLLLANQPAEALQARRSMNRDALQTLPAADDWPMFLYREMFTVPAGPLELGSSSTDVTHFGAAYHSVEYEWDAWLAEFEGLLRRMYWATATVHLQTPHSGTHVFQWESERGWHEPMQDDFQVRCEWSHDSLFA